MGSWSHYLFQSIEFEYLEMELQFKFLLKAKSTSVCSRKPPQKIAGCEVGGLESGIALEGILDLQIQNHSSLSGGALLRFLDGLC